MTGVSDHLPTSGASKGYLAPSLANGRGVVVNNVRFYVMSTVGFHDVNVRLQARVETVRSTVIMVGLGE